MPQITAGFVRRFSVPAFLIVVFLSVGPIVEIVIPAWPLRLHDVNWRLGVLNSAAAATGTEMLALLILVVVAQMALSSPALWTAFWYSIAVAVGYAVAAGVFALDSLQVRGRISGDQLTRFDMTIGWALARFAFTELVCLWLAACALAAARSLRRDAAREAADPRTGLIVGTGGQTNPAPVAPGDI